jgi:hypothetical protein
LTGQSVHSLKLKQSSKLWRASPDRKLVVENPRVRIDAAVNPLTKLERRVREPLLVILRRRFIPTVPSCTEGADYALF